MVLSPAGICPLNDCADEDQQQLQTTDPSSRQRRCYIGTITACVEFENDVAGRESQGA
jgi:hypothetical protein